MKSYSMMVLDNLFETQQLNDSIETDIMKFQDLWFQMTLFPLLS